MGNVLTISLRELRSYFVSPIAYLITGVFAFFTGFIFYNAITANMQAQMTDTFGWMLVLALIVAPALTMRLFAEENRQGTIEMLMTAPVRDWQIVIGKYIAGLITFIFLLVPSLWYLVLLWRYGPPDWGPVGSGYLGVILVGSAFIGIGMLASSLTSNQFIAYILAMISLLFMWVLNAPTAVLGSTGILPDLLSYLSLPSHFTDFFSGVIDSGHVLFFLSLAAIAVFLTARVVESRRWR